MAIHPPQGRRRIRFYEGARLTARDLREDAAYEARLRQLHVRTLHDTWGVAIGYEVGLIDQDRAVAVGPGIAYDCAGHELVSARTVILEPPPPPRQSEALAWWFDLLVRHRDEESLRAGRDPTGGREPECASPFEERPELRWLLAGDAVGEAPPLAPGPRLGEDVPLARFLVRAGGRLAGPDLSLRRNAQGLVRPHIAGAQVRQGSLAIHGSPLRWSVWIDTSDGGFDTDLPLYFVSLADHPLGESSGFAPLLGGESHEVLERLLGPFVSIDSAGTTGFRLGVRSAFTGQRDVRTLPPGLFRALRLKLPVAVNWLGLELVGGCPPAFRQPSLMLQRTFLETIFPALLRLSTSFRSGGET